MSNFSNNITNNLKPVIDLTNVSDISNQSRVSEYTVLNNFDHQTLDRMGSNYVNFELPNSSDTRQKTPFSNFVTHREPSLNFGMNPGLISNMTVLPNQLHRSLDLLAQTDQLTISSYNKNSNVIQNSSIISDNTITEPIDKFQGINTPYISYNEYEEPDAIFNNFSGNGRTDIIREYICHVNSIDRNIRRYQNPFNFLVKLAPLPGDTDASISRTFSNIRYLRIETAVIPRKYYINKTEIESNQTIIKLFPILINDRNLPSDNSIYNDMLDDSIKWVIIHSYNSQSSNTQTISYCKYESDIAINICNTFEIIKDLTTGQIRTYQYNLSNKSLEDDKYTILYLNDINDISNFSTDQILATAFNVMYPDVLTKNFIYVDCHASDKIYKFSELGNINKLELRLTNSIGKLLCCNLLAMDFNVPNIDSVNCTCNNNKQTGNTERDYKCICTYMRHPRYINFQLDIMFKFGIVETDFDKRAFN